jgi:hypothetical protein
VAKTEEELMLTPYRVDKVAEYAEEELELDRLRNRCT